MLHRQAVKGMTKDIDVEREHVAGAAIRHGIRTIARDGQHEIEVRKSRFVYSLGRTADEDAARAFIDGRRHAFWNASHNCSALRLGRSGKIERSNDDGEPSGTAGLPMLAALRHHDLLDVTAVVSRLFGGTLLGTGGLIRAYGLAVSETIARAGIVARQPRQRLQITVDYHDAGRIEHALRTAALDLADVGYGETSVTFSLAVEIGAVTGIESQVGQLTSGAATIRRTDLQWVEVPVPSEPGSSASPTP